MPVMVASVACPSSCARRRLGEIDDRYLRAQGLELGAAPTSTSAAQALVSPGKILTILEEEPRQGYARTRTSDGAERWLRAENIRAVALLGNDEADGSLGGPQVLSDTSRTADLRMAVPVARRTLGQCPQAAVPGGSRRTTSRTDAGRLRCSSLPSERPKISRRMVALLSATLAAKESATMQEKSFVRWTHPSVHLLVKGHRDPLAYIREKARSVAMAAMDEGWGGPPFDPIELAERLGLAVRPVADLPDARISPHPSAKALIEFNPNRARGRVRYSIAHEIGHYLFPDCLHATRHRLAQHEVDDPRDWQVEMLCNVAAAEFLMPLGSFPDLEDADLDIDRLMQLRVKYEVSSEALLLRVVRLVSERCLMFAARRIERGADAGKYHLDYAVAESGFQGVASKGLVLPADTVISHCTAIGFSAKGREVWAGGQALWVEAVGVPPYPGFRHPRVVGLARRDAPGQETRSTLSEVRGDALAPRSGGPRVLVHMVNDRTENWGGGGFANALARKWPLAQRRFREWIQADRSHLRLGAIHLSDVGEGIHVATIIGQKGYGPSRSPRVRYAALDEGLRAVAREALHLKATVHLPRIGTGLAGGSWYVIREIVQNNLVAAGLDVTVYTPPDGRGVRLAPFLQDRRPD